MAFNDVEKLLRYFNYDLLDKPTIFNGAQGSLYVKGSRVNFAEMITEEEQATMGSIHSTFEWAGGFR